MGFILLHYVLLPRGILLAIKYDECSRFENDSEKKALEEAKQKTITQQRK